MPAPAFLVTVYNFCTRAQVHLGFMLAITTIIIYTLDIAYDQD